MKSILKPNTVEILDPLWQALNLPRSCYLGNRITKKRLLSNEGLKASDKKLMTDGLDSLYWEYTLKPETINLSPLQTDTLDYGEIAVLKGGLRHPKRATRLAELLQRLIPYPMVLVLSYQQQFSISLALKRQNLADQQKLTVEALIHTDWLFNATPHKSLPLFYQSLNSQQLDWGNFYLFYLSLTQRVLALQRAMMTGQFQLDTQTLSASKQPRHAN